jgi:hypothetical protein
LTIAFGHDFLCTTSLALRQELARSALKVTENHGRLISGARPLARLILDDENKFRSMYTASLRREFGLFTMAGRICGYEHLIQSRLAEKLEAARQGQFAPARRARLSTAATPQP